MNNIIGKYNYWDDNFCKIIVWEYIFYNKKKVICTKILQRQVSLINWRALEWRPGVRMLQSNLVVPRWTNGKIHWCRVCRVVGALHLSSGLRILYINGQPLEGFKQRMDVCFNMVSVSIVWKQEAQRVWRWAGVGISIKKHCKLSGAEKFQIYIDTLPSKRWSLTSYPLSVGCA